MWNIKKSGLKIKEKYELDFFLRGGLHDYKSFIASTAENRVEWRLVSILSTSEM